jgi:hypothetical protein
MMRRLVALFLFALAGVAGAQPVQPTNIGYSNTTSGFGAWFFAGGATLGTGGSGTTALATRATNPGNLSGWVPAGNYGLAPTATGITVNAAADLNIPGATKAATVAMTGTLDAAKFGGAVLKFASKIVFPLQVGMALFDLANDLGFHTNGQNADGSPKWTQTIQQQQCSANCYSYGVVYNGVNYGSGFLDRGSACAQTITIPNQVKFSGGVPYGTDPTSSICSYTSYTWYAGQWQFNAANDTRSTLSVTAIPPYNNVTTQDATNQDLANKIASESGWPSNFGDAPARLARDVMQGQDGLTGQKSGAGPQDLQLNNPTLSGPSSVPGPSSNSTDSSGKTTTNTTNYTLTYNTNTVNYNTSSVTNTTNPDGTTQTSTVTQTAATPPPDLCQQHPDSAGCSSTNATDTPLPTVPTLYTQKYPNGLKGVWDAAKAQMMATPIGQLSTQLMPTIGDGGSCPKITIPLDLGLWNYGTGDLSPDCSTVWGFGKVVVIVSALLLARALIFGG